MPRTFISTLLYLSLLLACAAAARADGFGTILADRFDTFGVPGLGYAVVEAGRVVQAGGLGVADATTGRPVDADTPFRVASLTKPIAAALILNAAEAGTLDLEAPLRAASAAFREHCPQMRAHFEREDLPFLDGIPCGSDAITVRHVLSHVAGDPPGGAFRYNGFLYGLLSEPVARARDAETFGAVLRAEVIEPLGLTHSAAGIEDGAAQEVLAALAVPHRRVAGTWKPRAPLEDSLNAGAGFIASARDMGRLDAAIRTRLVADPALWTRMTIPVKLIDGSASPYGIGWFVQRIDGRAVVWHHGHQPDAYSALWVRDVAHRRSLVVLANSDGLAAGRDLHLGDLRRSEVALAFLAWSQAR